MYRKFNLFYTYNVLVYVRTNKNERGIKLIAKVYVSILFLSLSHNDCVLSPQPSCALDPN